MRLDCVEFTDKLAYLRSVNAAGLKDMEFVAGDVLFRLPDRLVEEWEFTGLSNRDLVEMAIGAFRERGLTGLDELADEMSPV